MHFRTYKFGLVLSTFRVATCIKSSFEVSHSIILFLFASIWLVYLHPQINVIVPQHNSEFSTLFHQKYHIKHDTFTK